VETEIQVLISSKGYTTEKVQGLAKATATKVNMLAQKPPIQGTDQTNHPGETRK